MRENATQLDLLRRYLADRSVACPGCGRDLRNHESDRCPGCRRAFSLRLRTEGAGSTPWLAGLVGLTMAFGFNFLSVVLVLILETTALSPGRWGVPILIASLAQAILVGVALIAWTRAGRTLARRSRPVACALALLCWVPPVVAPAAVAATAIAMFRIIGGA